MKKRRAKYGNRTLVRNDQSFRSELEAHTARQLTDNGIPWTYESVEHELLPASRSKVKVYAPKGHVMCPSFPSIRKTVYIPDFMDPDGRWAIEVKGFKTDVFQLKWKMFLAQLSTTKEPPVLFLPSTKKEVNETVRIIAQLISESEKVVHLIPST